MKSRQQGNREREKEDGRLLAQHSDARKEKGEKRFRDYFSIQ